MRLNVLTRALGTLCCVLVLGASCGRAADVIQTGLVGAPNAPNWLWFVGLQKGFFTEAGVTVDLIYGPNPSGLVQQLAAGSLDIVGDVGAVEPIHAVEKGAPVALLRLMGQVAPYELLGKPTIASVEDLKGKTICIGGLFDINRVYIERITQRIIWPTATSTSPGNTPGRFAARKSGTVDATLLSPPVNFLAEDAGFRKLGMIRDYAKDLPFSAMDVSLTYAAKHRDALAKLLGAMDRSAAWFHDLSHRDEAIDILAKEMKSQRDPVARLVITLRDLPALPATAGSRAPVCRASSTR